MVKNFRTKISPTRNIACNSKNEGTLNSSIFIKTASCLLLLHYKTIAFPAEALSRSLK